MSEITFLSATELAAKIRSREIGCEELLRHYLERVDRYNDGINAIVVDLREQALAAARAADRALAAGDEVGPLHGVPMTVKESYNLAGAPTTWGNPEWRDNVVEEDAESVKKLKAAGAVVFGKTNVPLLLADFQSYNDVYGTTNNPYNLKRGPGGSSGGSAAALAAGLVALETGSDIGGSIRNPAHFCGLFGHKPTWNLLWMRGHAPPGDMRSTPDISAIGPLARSAVDLEAAVMAMAGPDPINARGYRLDLPTLAGRSLKDLKVAVGRTTPWRRWRPKCGSGWSESLPPSGTAAPWWTLRRDLTSAPTLATEPTKTCCGPPWRHGCRKRTTNGLGSRPPLCRPMTTAPAPGPSAPRCPPSKCGSKTTSGAPICAGSGTSSSTTMTCC